VPGAGRHRRGGRGQLRRTTGQCSAQGQLVEQEAIDGRMARKQRGQQAGCMGGWGGVARATSPAVIMQRVNRWRRSGVQYLMPAAQRGRQHQRQQQGPHRNATQCGGQSHEGVVRGGGFWLHGAVAVQGTAKVLLSVEVCIVPCKTPRCRNAGRRINRASDSAQRSCETSPPSAPRPTRNNLRWGCSQSNPGGRPRPRCSWPGAAPRW